MPEILAFVDTNVLLYAASTDPSEAGKRTEARRVLSDEAFAFSVQVCIGSGWSTGFLRKAKRSRCIAFVKSNILNQVCRQLTEYSINNLYF